MLGVELGMTMGKVEGPRLGDSGREAKLGDDEGLELRTLCLVLCWE